MRKLLVMGLLVFAMFALVACGGNDDTESNGQGQAQVQNNGSQAPPASESTTTTELYNAEDEPQTTGTGLGFTQLRDNELDVVVSLGDSLAVFEEAFGEGLFRMTGRLPLGENGEHIDTLFYNFLDLMITVEFDAETQTAVRIQVPSTFVTGDDRAATIGRFSAYEVTLGISAEEASSLTGIGIRWGGGIGALTPNGNVVDGNANAAALSTGLYSLALNVQQDILTTLTLTQLWHFE